MARRRKIGIIYNYNENWIGGTYYIQNLITALKCTSTNDIPKLYIYTEKDEHFDQLKVATVYPFLYRGGLYPLRKIFGRKLINAVSILLLNKKPFNYFKKKLDVVFPAKRDESPFHPNQSFIYWIPDFQEHYLPEFFTEKVIETRKAYQRSILLKAKNLLFSSLSVQEDFNEIYPGANIRQFVLPFAVTHPKLNTDENFLKKYGIDEPYFICCNQFWKHKNHIRVLEAIKIVKDEGGQVKVVFTGKAHDDRNPDYFNEIKKLVKELNIEANVSILGFIDRADQLGLMNSSMAIIQPSLFEGWSTVIEDGKSLNVNVIASDLRVHREQLETYSASMFFNPYKSEQLAEKMMLIWLNEGRLNKYDYSESIKKFRQCFLDIVDSI